MAALPPSPFSFTLIGAGRVGTAVAQLLRRSGHSPIAVSSRSEASAERASQLLGCPVADPATAVKGADVILIGAGDDAIAEVVGSVAASLEPAAIVVHFAGALALEPLDAAIQAGALGAALHPVQACPDVETALRRLPGSAWGVTVSEELEEWARGLITDALRGLPVVVPAEARPLWHAAAVMTSNGIAALLAIGESILDAIPIDRPEEVLGPLARGTIQNAIEGGGGGATLTGPVVRGEAETIARHLGAIDERTPSLAGAYRDVMRVIVAAAEAAGRISGGSRAEWERLLENRR